MDKTERAIGLSIMTYHKTLMNPWTSIPLTVVGCIFFPPALEYATAVGVYQTVFLFYDIASKDIVSPVDIQNFTFQAGGTIVGFRFPISGLLIQELQYLQPGKGSISKTLIGLEKVPISDRRKRDIMLFKGP